MYTHSTDAGWISRTHQAIQPFRLQKPETVADVLEALSGTENATLIAGGIDLIRRMRNGDRWDNVIDISGVSGMDGISDQGEVIRIGALATHWEIETSALLADRLPQFQAAWKTIGNVRIRMMGTLGGNLMAREAGYDGPVLLAAAGARIFFEGPQGEISVSAGAGPDGFPAGAVLTAVEIPVAGAQCVALDRSLKPVVSAAVGLRGETANVAVGCAFDKPFFWTGPISDIGDKLAGALPQPRDNPMGSAAYRQRMIGVLARRLADGLQSGDAP